MHALDLKVFVSAVLKDDYGAKHVTHTPHTQTYSLSLSHTHTCTHTLMHTLTGGCPPPHTHTRMRSHTNTHTCIGTHTIIELAICSMIPSKTLIVQICS